MSGGLGAGAGEGGLPGAARHPHSTPPTTPTSFSRCSFSATMCWMVMATEYTQEITMQSGIMCSMTNRKLG